MHPSAEAVPSEPSSRPGQVSRGRRWPRLLLRLVAAVTLTALVLLAPTAWLRLSARGRIHQVADAPSLPVAVVFGAGVANGHPTPFLSARLDVAVQLYDTGRTKVVLVSGDNRTAGYDEPTAMRDYLIAHGIPAERIVADYAGRDTYDSCVRAVRIFGVNEALVISQGYHLPRVVGTCRAVGLDAQGVGDWTAARYPAVWITGSAREILAAWKTLYDVASHRDPVLGPTETGVQDALSGAETT